MTAMDPAAIGIDAGRMHALLTELCDLGRKLPGSDAEKAACAIITRELAAAGAASAVHEFHAFIGWPTAPRLEELRDAWIDAPGLATQQRIAREIQVVGMDEQPCIPLGAIYRSTALSRTLRDRVTGFPIFWNIARG